MNKSLKSWPTFIFLVIIFIIALFIRLYPVLKTPEPIFQGFGPYGDSYLYHVIGYNLYKGNGFSGLENGQVFGSKTVEIPPKYQSAITRGPVYPFFISMVYRIWGKQNDMATMTTWHKNWDKIRIIQCFLDAFVCLIVFFIDQTIIKDSIFPALISAFLILF